MAVIGKKIIKIGVDFDGVVAYNPFRVIRAPITFVKRKLLRRKKLAFMIPQSWWQKLAWSILHQSSVFPAKGVEQLRELATNPEVELYLITARYNFLNPGLHKWLDDRNLTSIFKNILTNNDNSQPHRFKEKAIKNLKLDYFVEDNLDVVIYLEKVAGVRVLWIYNLVDKILYPQKTGYPYLEAALEEIRTREKI